MNIQSERIKNKYTERIIENIRKITPLKFAYVFILFVCFSLMGVAIQSLIQNGFFSGMHFIYIRYPAIVALNAFPLLLVMLAVYFACGKMYIGLIAAYVPLIVLNIINFFKTVYRDEPLKMSDFGLINEVFDITQNYEFRISAGIIAALTITVVLIYFSAKYIKTKKIKSSVRAIGAIAAVLCMVLSYQFVYKNKQLYEAIPTYADKYYDTSMARHHGMLYTFLVSSDATQYEMPNGYSDEEAEKIIEQKNSSNVGKETEKINVIAVMGEAFFDITRGNTAQFEGDSNPYENYHRIKSEGYYGEMTVPGFGGGTEASEFEFLTGTSLYLIDENMPTAYKTYVTRPVYSLVRYFKESGYDTTAIHPGHSWFYNRKNAYAYLGFDEFIAREDMDEDAPSIYGYIEDSYTTEQIISDYLEHYEENPDTPYFNFTVTIQNHGPYPDHECGREVLYVRPDGITDENYWIVNNYLSGIAATDKLLGDICDFTEQREEPFVVLFFGDHLPYLDKRTDCFNAFGYNISHRTEEGLENKYKVEYVMYSNESAKNIIEKSLGNVKTGKGNEISSCFLGNELLDYMGLNKPGYFEFVNDVENEINVISSNFYKSGDLKMNTLEGEKADLLEKYKRLQYYNLKRYKNEK